MNYRPEEIEALVRQIVARVMGEDVSHLPPTSAEKRPLIDADFINQLPINATLPVPPNALITPLARQAALERHIQLENQAAATPSAASPGQQTIAIGADHGGYGLKETLKKMLTATLPEYVTQRHTRERVLEY